MLKIFPMGGIGGVTKNMFVYELDDDLLVVDCGIGFAPDAMPGVDILVPDTRYLLERLEQGATLHGIVLTHGHDDHIAALPYVLREIGVDVPIFGSPLTAEFAMTRIADQEMDKQVEYFPEEPLELGPFTIENVKITHSVPDTRHLIIRTPEGVIYHGSDFKIDLTPIDGQTSDLQRIAQIGREGILCALLDCLRIERRQPTSSESVLREALRREMHGVEGKVVVTLMSSNLHRVQQVIDVAAEYGRRVGFVGRSVEQNVNTAMNMGILEFPPNLKINKRNTDSVPDNQLCLVVAGSQGQPTSSLVRAVSGSHPHISMKKGDKVIIASEPIPGNETNVYDMIDELAQQRIEVAYSDIEGDLHVSGHAGEYEQMLMVHLLKPKFLFPIGGEERHRVRFQQVVTLHGYEAGEVVMPLYGKIVEFENGKFRYGKQIELIEKTVTVTGTSSEVLDQVMNDRQIMSKEGVVTLAIVKKAGSYDLNSLVVDERGFGINGEEEKDQFKMIVRQAVTDALASNPKDSEVRLAIARSVRQKMRQEADKDPMVLVSIL